MEDYKELSDALQESNELLQEEVTRLRNRNRVLMAVKSQLRRKIEDIIKEKDSLFLSMCQDDLTDMGGHRLD